MKLTKSAAIFAAIRSRRCSRYSIRSRTSRSETTISICRSTFTRAIHLHGESARNDLAAAARPHGDHIAGRLYGDGEAADRQALPRQKAARGQRPEPVAGPDQRYGFALASSTTTRAKRACAISSARSVRRSVKSLGKSRKIPNTRRASNRKTSPSTFRNRAITTRTRNGSRRSAFRRVWCGRRSAATFSSSKSRRCRARGSSC